MTMMNSAIESYTGQLMLFSGNFVPSGWVECDGRLLEISHHQALFAVIGTMYGGNGQVNFAVPDLRGVLPVHRQTQVGKRYVENAGAEPTVNIHLKNVPPHNHKTFDQGLPLTLEADVSLNIKAIDGSAEPVEGGYLAKGNGGSGDADIYAGETVGKNAPTVRLKGGTARAQIVGDATSFRTREGAPLPYTLTSTEGLGQPLVLPHIEMMWCICTSGIFPTRD